MREPELRPELATILNARYGDQRAATARPVAPSERDVEYYVNHHGRLSLYIDLTGDPHLTVIDTSKLIHLRHYWISTRHTLGFNVNLASGNQQVSKEVLRTGTFDGRVEGLELIVHYGNQHNRDIPYTAELKPLW